MTVTNRLDKLNNLFVGPVGVAAHILNKHYQRILYRKFHEKIGDSSFYNN